MVFVSICLIADIFYHCNSKVFVIVSCLNDTKQHFLLCRLGATKHEIWHGVSDLKYDL